MKRDLFTLPLALPGELIIDNFAGGGGASTGIERAFGRPVDVAINHNAEALAMHAANHPHTAHYCESVWDIDPIEVTKNQPVGLVWLSPDCKHFSKAKGGKPVEKKIRGLAWVALRWAAKCQPRVIMLENVEEFKTWGPLQIDAEGNARPDPSKKGQTFRSFVRQLQGLGYAVDWKEMRACDYGAPTIRKRFFMVARRDGLPISRPKVTHGAPTSKEVRAGKLLPWRTAAECIDWSIPCLSIFERKKPLADATNRRIAKGIMRDVIDAKEPFILPTRHNASTGDLNVRNHQHDQSQATGQSRPQGRRAPPNRGVGGVIARSGKADECTDAIHGKCSQEPAAIRSGLPNLGRAGEIATPPPKGSDSTIEGDASFSTGRAGTHEGVATAAAHTLVTTGYGERPGQSPRVPGLHKPLGTVVAGQKHALVSVFLAKHYTGVVGSDLQEPMGTVTSADHHSLVTAHIQRDMGKSIGHAAGAPLATITAGGGGKAALVTSNRIKLRGTSSTAATDEPLHTISAGGQHHAEVRAFLLSYYGSETDADSLGKPARTVTSRDRLGLVTIKGQDYQIVDIGLRMLSPRELFTAQGFPAGYIIGDDASQGLHLTKTAQVRMCGNSVCPPLSEALVRANFAHEALIYGRQAA